MLILIILKPDGNVELTLHPGPVLDVLEDVDWLLAVAVDVDRTTVHLRESLHEEKEVKQVNIFIERHHLDLKVVSMHSESSFPRHINLNRLRDELGVVVGVALDVVHALGAHAGVHLLVAV